MEIRRRRLVPVGLGSILLACLISGCSSNAPKPPADDSATKIPASTEKPAGTPAPAGKVDAEPAAAPPQKPPIIIDPGDNLVWKIGEEPASADTTMTGNKLNECAFGSKSQFFAMVQTPDNPSRKVELVAAVLQFGTKTLDISADGSGQFIWKLDSQVLVPYRPNAIHRWRQDLMVTPNVIQISPFEQLSQPYTVVGIGTKANGSCLNP